MSKEYLADDPFICSRCDEPQDEGSELFFHKGKKICGSCHEQIESGDGNERFSEDGFGQPEY